MTSKHKSSFIGFPQLLLVAGVAYSTWTATQFSATGYWDDTIAFVYLADQVPRQPIAAISWILNQTGELYGPLPLGLAVLLEFLGLQSNFALTLLGNLALVGLVSSIYRILFSLGAKQCEALLVGMLLFLYPTLIDQKSQFVPIQHTLTVWLALESIYTTHKFLRHRDEGIHNLKWMLAKLNILVLALALSREPGAVLAILVIGYLISHRQPLTVLAVATWTIPIFLTTYRVFSGRLGSHTTRAFTEYGFGNLTSDSDGQSIISSTTLFLTITLCALLITQFILIRHVDSLSQASKPELDSAAKNSLILPSFSTTDSLFLTLIYLLSLIYPSMATLSVVNSAYMSLLFENEIFEQRWSLVVVNRQTLLFGFLMLVIFLILATNTLTRRVFLVTTLTSAPYLIANIFRLGDESEISEFSRYSPYFLPSAACILFSVLRGFVLLKKLMKTHLIVYFSVVTLVTTSLFSGFLTQHHLIKRRVQDFQSVETEICDFGSYILPSDFTRRYLGLTFNRNYFPGIDEIFVGDKLLMSKFQNVDIEFDSNRSLEWAGYCLSELNPRRVLNDIDVLNDADPRFQSRIEYLKKRALYIDTDSLLNELWTLISEMRDAKHPRIPE